MNSQYKKLETLDINGLANYLKTCKNIIFVNGAGISTGAGIPDFRSPKSGLYSQLEKLNLPKNVRPEDLFTFDYFKKDPVPYFTRLKWFLPMIKEPALSHYFQSMLTQKGLVRRIYTQNIDCLETASGVPNDKLIQGHGSVKTGHCLSCKTIYNFEWIKNTLEEKGYLRCENKACLESREDDKLKIIRPDVVMFGEEMPNEFYKCEEDFDECDCLIVSGTSLQVAPFSLLPSFCRNDCPRVLINRDLVGEWDRKIYNNYRDIALLGNCDEIYLQLAELMGFKDELEKLFNNKIE